MIKTLTIVSLVLSGLIALGGTAQAAGRGCRRGGTTATPYVAQSTAGAEGYRTYSYEPGLAPVTTPRYYSQPSRPFSGFHSAGWKITGDR
jgi:hypothetical protein